MCDHVLKDIIVEMQQEPRSAKMNDKPAIVPKNILFSFLLLSTCFAMWGLSNNMTDPLVKAFKDIFDSPYIFL